MLTNKNHVIGTRKHDQGHYQIVIFNVQSGKCLKILADAVQTDQTDSEFECYVEGLYQGFVNPQAFNKLFVTEEDDADDFARKVGLTESEMFHAEEDAYRKSLRPHACVHCDERCDCGRDSSDCDWCIACAPSAEDAGIQIGPWNAEVRA